jgi:hypothetical protein
MSESQYTSIAWNSLTVSDSNKPENVQNKFADLYFSLCYQFDFLLNYDLILQCLEFRALYYGRRYLDSLYFNVFNEKISCYSIMDTELYEIN